MQGYLSLVLHAHLPFVRHPEHDKFLEESWLFEAITEGTCLHILPYVFADFKKQYPEVSVNIKRSDYAKILESICCSMRRRLPSLTTGLRNRKTGRVNSEIC